MTYVFDALTPGEFMTGRKLLKQGMSRKHAWRT